MCITMQLLTKLRSETHFLGIKNTPDIEHLHPFFSTYPFLSVGVLHIVDSQSVPLFTETEESANPETVLSHDDEVHEETSGSLDHTDLSIGHTYQSVKQEVIKRFNNRNFDLGLYLTFLTFYYFFYEFFYDNSVFVMLV